MTGNCSRSRIGDALPSAATNTVAATVSPASVMTSTARSPGSTDEILAPKDTFTLVSCSTCHIRSRHRTSSTMCPRSGSPESALSNVSVPAPTCDSPCQTRMSRYGLARAAAMAFQAPRCPRMFWEARDNA